jgi:hypothetical protein
MKQFRIVLISTVLCCAASLSAQEHRTIEIAGGISRLNTNTDSTIALQGTNQFSASNDLIGWNGSVATNVHGNLLLVADVSNHHAGGFWVNGPLPAPNLCVRNFGCGPTYYVPPVRTWAYLFGPRISLRINDKNALFAQGLLGGVQRKSSNTSASGMGLGLGGYDRGLFGPIGLRFQAELMPSRIQGRWNGDTRIGLGAVFRF